MPLRICILINVFVTAFSSSGRTEILPSPTPISKILEKLYLSPLPSPNLHIIPPIILSINLSIHLSVSLSVTYSCPAPSIEPLCPVSQLSIEEAGQAWNPWGGGGTLRSSRGAFSGTGFSGRSDKGGHLAPQAGRHGGLRENVFFPEILRIPCQ